MRQDMVERYARGAGDRGGGRARLRHDRALVPPRAQHEAHAARRAPPVSLTAHGTAQHMSRHGTRHGTCHGTACKRRRAGGFYGGVLPSAFPAGCAPAYPALVHAAPCRAVPARRSARGCSPRCAIHALRVARCAFERIRRMPHAVWAAAAALSWSRASGSSSTTTSRTRSAPSPTRRSRPRSSCRTTPQERSPRVCSPLACAHWRVPERACACARLVPVRERVYPRSRWCGPVACEGE